MHVVCGSCTAFFLLAFCVVVVVAFSGDYRVSSLPVVWISECFLFLHFVVVVVVVKTMMGSSVASVFSSSLLLLLLLALLSVVQAEVLFDSNLTIGRNTLSGTRIDLRW